MKNSNAYQKSKAAIGKVGTAMGSGLQEKGKSMMAAGGVLGKVAGAAAWAGGTLGKTLGKVGRSVGKFGVGALRAGGKFAKKQAKLGVYDFFHPNASGDERDTYKASLDKK